MFRLLAGLALVSPLVGAGIAFALPDLVDRELGPYGLLIVLVVTGGLFLVASSAVVTHAWIGWRLRRLALAVERIAAGDAVPEVPVPRGGAVARLARAVNALAATIGVTREAATIDKLTGVANRQALLGGLFNEVERAARYDRPLSIAFVDIDHFKNVNDTYGHAAGDIVLRGVAQAIKANLRHTDVIGRYGGEEFMLVLTETGVDDGAQLAEKLRTLVSRLRFEVEGNGELEVTVSIGIAGGHGKDIRIDAIVRDADAAMYSAKSLGRNQTYVFAEPDEDARVPRAPLSAFARARAHEVAGAAREAATSALTAAVAPLASYRGRPSPLIATIVSAMAERLDLPDADVDRLRIAALLHDVGKLAIPDEILEKPAPLSPEEWRTVVQHPRIGQVILEQAATLKEAAPIILHHHERYAGHGYPFGLRGNDIPLGARIVAIADAYDAMRNDRPYKRALSHDQAVAEVRRHAGTQFDPELVALFCELFASAAPEPDPTVRAMIDRLRPPESAAERRVSRPRRRGSAGGPGGPGAAGPQGAETAAG
jgi:diguanylate cyclase (GGDEF)-like protein